MKLSAPFPVSVFIIIFLSRLFPLAAQPFDQSSDTLTINFATPDLVTFCVRDLKNSIVWYKEVLNCELLEQQVDPVQKIKLARLGLGDFHIELVQKESSIDIHDTSFEENGNFICGFKSFGFRVSNFDDFYQFISTKKMTYLSDIEDNSFTASRFFVVHDVDENELVFIEDLRETGHIEEADSSHFKLIPYWASIVVEDLESEVDWFEDNLGFYFYRKLDYENIETRLLLTDGFILELKHYREKTITRENILQELKTSSLLGLNKLTFKVDNINMVMSHMIKNDVDLEVDLSESEYAWAKKYFLVNDSEENLIEIIQ